MSPPCLNDEDLEQLRYLYVTNGMSASEVAKFMYCSRTTIIKYCKLLGISRGRGGPNRWKNREMPVEQIRFMYERLNWTQQQIVDYYGWKSTDSVKRIMRKHGIPIRSRSAAAKLGYRRRRLRQCVC